MENFEGPAPRERQDRRTVLDRILETPHLEHVIPRLQPELLHRVVQTCGLEDCGELVMLATPEQLRRIFDLDLWRFSQPGMAGCGLQGRSFTTQEAWDAAAATCNLGLENWPSQWIRAKALPNDFLVHHDLVTVFQVGWTMLHREVSMYTAQQLLEVLGRFQCEDCSVQAELDELRIQLSSCYRTGMPWRARNALDVIAILDMAAWTALLGLIDECPVLHAALRASQTPRTRSVSASAFEFISENSQIAFIREFMQSLPDTLRQ